MAGTNSPYDMTYLTAPVEYRTEITEVDPTPLVDDNGDRIPEIRMDVNMTKKAYDAASKFAPKYEVSSRAYNGHLELYVHLDIRGDPPRYVINEGLLPTDDTTPHANIRVWGWSGTDHVNGRWCVVFEQSVVADTLLIIRNIPNTKYVVTVSELSAVVVSSIVEQHTV